MSTQLQSSNMNSRLDQIRMPLIVRTKIGAFLTFGIHLQCSTTGARSGGQTLAVRPQYQSYIRLRSTDKVT